MSHRRYLLILGSNKGNREKFITSAIYKLSHHYPILRVSRFREYPACCGALATFLNAAVVVKGPSDPRELFKITREIEISLGGREKPFRWAPRTIDIDIWLAENLVFIGKDLQIPHYAMHQRIFALETAVEISPYWWHPILRKTIRRLYLENLKSLSPSL